MRSALSKELLNALAKNAGSEQAGSKTEGVFQGIGTVPDEDDFTVCSFNSFVNQAGNIASSPRTDRSADCVGFVVLGRIAT